MAQRIEDVEGIGPAYGQRLRAAGVKTDAELLQAGASAQGRGHLAAQTGISASLLLKWVNHADLMRIRGVGPQFAELLEAAGVDTVKEMAQRNAANLAETLAATTKKNPISGTSPAVSQVSRWIAQAKKLESKVTY